MKSKSTKGTNTGKKYKKLRGDELPTPENEASARKFMEWYAANMKKLEYYVQGSSGVFDEDIFNDTFLVVYDNISLKGCCIKNYTGYFLQSYRNTYINHIKFEKNNNTESIEIQHRDYYNRLHGNCCDTSYKIIESSLYAYSQIDSAKYEEIIETISSEVMAYVQDNYDEVSVSLFEMYVGLAPDISYKRLADMLGYSEFKIWPVIGKIKKDVNKRFGKRKDYLLSIVNF